jgi:hypothetical protein
MRLIALLAALTLATACGGSSGSTDSGIRGRAVIFPACPVEPCAVATEPTAYVGAFVVEKDGTVVEKVSTDHDGRFEVRLEPGRYVLRSEAEAEALPLLKPTEVTVREHEFTNVTLLFDSGIR